MPRGQPDFGQYQAKEVGATLSDMADLAVRLGSIVEYDRRGDVAYLDDYEAPINRFKPTVSAGCLAILNSEQAYSKAQCLKLATAGVLGDYVNIEYDLAPLVTGRHGIKLALAPYAMSIYNSKYDILCTIQDGAYRHILDIELNSHDRTLKYHNNIGVMTTFETAFLMFGAAWGAWHNIKIVWDLTTGKYVRFMFDNLTWDMSDYNYQKDAFVGTPYIAPTFYFEDLEGHAHTLWQDNFVYTVNEP